MNAFDGTSSPRRARITILDEYRGFALLGMILFHALYDWLDILNFSLPKFILAGMRPFQIFLGVSFVAVCGISCHLSKKNGVRGMILLVVAVVITAATTLLMPSQVIRFGVLHLLGVCCLLYALANSVINKIPAIPGLVIFILLFYITYPLPSGFLQLGPLKLAVPEFFYQSEWFYWLGLPHPGFYSADYYPLLPWGFIFLAGSCLGKLILSKKLPDFCFRVHSRFLGFLGRHTLPIYVLHQPVLLGIFSLAAMFLR